MAKKFCLVQLITNKDEPDLVDLREQEGEQLIMTYGGVVVVKLSQKLPHPNPDMYIGPGKVEWLKSVVEEKKIDVVVINAIVKPSQLFRIEKILWEISPTIVVWDRVDLILAIFQKHAFSMEAKLQIELAKINHTGPRIYGLGRTVLSRQGGGIGQRGGSGETNIEFEKRLMKKRRGQILKELSKLSTQKSERITRRQEKGYGPVALVGYTSAGKTTLFNRLTGKHKEMHLKLFTTLDTVVGKMKSADNRLPILVSDTIGFIQELPPDLIEAFKSTLLESVSAKLILHVVDVTDSKMQEKVDIVTNILKELRISVPVVYVLNKIDLLMGSSDLESVKTKFLGQNAYAISAVTGEGVEQLKEFINQTIVNNANLN